MAKTDKLHELIHSLSKAEKRFFKLYANLSGKAGDKKYPKLFEEILGMETYDEERLKAALKERGLPVKYLSSDKNYLYAQILEALATQHRGQSAKNRIRQCMDMADILYGKGLLSQALRQCRRAKSLALRHHTISLMPDILLTERTLVAHGKGDVGTAEGEVEGSIQHLSNFNRADTLYRQSVRLLQRQGKTRSEEDTAELKHIRVALEGMPSEGLGIHSLIRRQQTLAVLHYMEYEHRQEYEAMSKNIELMDDAPDFKREHPFEYATFFSHLLRLSKTVDRPRYPELLGRFFQFAEDLGKEDRKVQARVYSLGYSTELVRALEEGDFEEGIKHIGDIQGKIKRYGKLVPRSIQMTFEYKFAYLHYAVGGLGEALGHINHLLNHYAEDERPDVYRFARIFSLIIHHELGNHSLVSYQLRSVRNLLKNRKQLYRAETIILSAIRQLSRHPAEGAALAPLREEMLGVLSASQREARVLEYFDFITWLDSRITGVPFREMKTANLQAGLLPIKHQVG